MSPNEETKLTELQSLLKQGESNHTPTSTEENVHKCMFILQRGKPIKILLNLTSLEFLKSKDLDIVCRYSNVCVCVCNTVVLLKANFFGLIFILFILCHYNQMHDTLKRCSHWHMYKNGSYRGNKIKQTRGFQNGASMH